jgi:hypothetical protein
MSLPWEKAREIVCEEWHRIVKEFGLRPGSVTEVVIARIIKRLEEAKQWEDHLEDSA